MPKSLKLEKQARENPPQEDLNVCSENKRVRSSPPYRQKGLVRKDAALRRLGFKKQDLDSVPEISSILKSTMGSVKKAIAAMRFSNQACIQTFLDTYDAVPEGDREYLSLEAIALKAGVKTPELLGATLLSCKTLRAQESALIAMNSHRKVLKKTIEYAMEPGGHKDRQMLHEAIGFLPSPRGVNMSVNLLGGNPQYTEPKKEEPESGGDIIEGSAEDDFVQAFPSVNGKLEEWSTDRNKLLADRT